MKTIILIAKNIRYYYRCSRPVFLLFAAGMLCASLLPALQRGELRRIIFMATGALMSVTSSQQGESIPGIAHAVVLESPRR